VNNFKTRIHAVFANVNLELSRYGLCFPINFVKLISLNITQSSLTLLEILFVEFTSGNFPVE
jgi:hypothetical protein